MSFSISTLKWKLNGTFDARIFFAAKVSSYFGVKSDQKIINLLFLYFQFDNGNYKIELIFNFQFNNAN